MAKQTRVSNANMMTLSEKTKLFSWGMFIPMCLVLIFSITVLVSAGGGSWQKFAIPQMIRIALGFGVFFIATFTNIKVWIKSAYWFYALALILIIMVTFIGHEGMGAQRWLDLGFMHIQPSEIIKIAIVLVLARHFSWMNSSEASESKNYILPFFLMLVPFILIVMQPDLGTALSLGLITIGMFYITGAKKKWFIIAAVIAVMIAPVIWFGGLKDYQRDRIITFVNPGHDYQGAGYQINQAKIAFGSGGLTGKGYMSGTQSQQQFLPEKHTDFIFTMLGEEFGFIGALMLLMVYSIIIAMLFWCAKSSRNRFGQLVCFGFMLNFFIYYFINIAMVLGLMPTVGIPLPLMSFGGSSLLSLMFGLGLCQNVHIHKNQQLSAKGF